MIEHWRQRARQLTSLIHALTIAMRDPRTPWPARFLTACVVGYALSPIDLIPDPIPVLGYLDDLVLLPLGIALAIRVIPGEVWADAQREAVAATRDDHSGRRIGAVVIVALWIIMAVAGVLLVRHWTS